MWEEKQTSSAENLWREYFMKKFQFSVQAKLNANKKRKGVQNIPTSRIFS